ncbi:7 transmembrane receptor (rhodopsin family) domain-containing protein [Ditylenchus destructor]|uniref:7 transmembrane receptor (Rhodopsin family) domain-containing protein n=1 Tax=Ditylenchus destructor TaxID=166010 RepID=A0AAD4MUI4_9BILA|nr:7 transmembrane receptor (rhodopsin family) domain-containing protein [Ditylenchus destructor]
MPISMPMPITSEEARTSLYYLLNGDIPPRTNDYEPSEPQSSQTFASELTLPIMEGSAADQELIDLEALTENTSIMDMNQIDALIYFFYGVILVVGAVMNFYVIYRMRRFRRRDREQYQNGIGICLYTMAAADLVALASLILHFAVTASSPMISEGFHNTMCKVILFSTHTAYTQSMWCWLFMSGLRYIATTRPLQYTTLWRIPCTAMSVVLGGAILENAWLLFTVHSVQSEAQPLTCTQQFDVMNRSQRVIDILISFVVPTLLVLYMDMSVLCCRPGPKSSDPMLQIVINRPSCERKRMIYRFLVVTVSSLVLNVPENMLRLLAAFGLLSQSGERSALAVFGVELSQAMFFAQFAFNAFYLTTFVYDKSVLSKTNSSRQLSLSFRHRLEESSHMIRERASTISYRATTPTMPSLPAPRTPTPTSNGLISPGPIARYHSACQLAGQSSLDAQQPDINWL